MKYEKKILYNPCWKLFQLYEIRNKALFISFTPYGIANMLIVIIINARLKYDKISKFLQLETFLEETCYLSVTLTH